MGIVPSGVQTSTARSSAGDAYPAGYGCHRKRFAADIDTAKAINIEARDGASGVRPQPLVSWQASIPTARCIGNLLTTLVDTASGINGDGASGDDLTAFDRKAEAFLSAGYR